MTTTRDNRWMSEPMTVSRFKDLIRKNSIDAAFHVVPMGIVMAGGGVDIDVPNVHYSRLVEIWAYPNQARCDADTDGLAAMARAYVIDDEYNAPPSSSTPAPCNCKWCRELGWINQ